MLKSVPGLLAVALCLGASASTMCAAQTIGGVNTSVFVMTNDNVKNEILTYQRSHDGQFILTERVATGGRGSGGQTDPLQSQGALTISGDHTLLFAVNSASGTVSSFRLLNGLPVFIDRENSGGAFPIAVTECRRQRRSRRIQSGWTRTTSGDPELIHFPHQHQLRRLLDLCKPQWSVARRDREGDE
jgi:6-phosphogluconolactonase